MHNAAGCFGSRSLATKSRHSSLIYLVVLQARETYLDKYKKLEPEIKDLDEEVKKFRDDRAEANTPALGSRRPRARVFVAIFNNKVMPSASLLRLILLNLNCLRLLVHLEFVSLSPSHIFLSPLPLFPFLSRSSCPSLSCSATGRKGNA